MILNKSIDWAGTHPGGCRPDCHYHQHDEERQYHMKKFLAILMTVVMTAMLFGVLAGSALAEEAQAPEDGVYTVSVELEGGSGKATIQSPCKIEMKEGQITATIIWSSENYDYMIVADEKIDPIRVEGGSTFEIPVASLEEPLTVIGDTTAMSQPHEIEYTLTFDPSSLTPALEDGVYSALFTTDSSMFHVNEAMEDRGVLTVKNGEMTIHITLVSKSIENLFPGLVEDAEKEGAELLQPTEDEVTYSDGYTETVYGFDVPVPYLDEEFDLALIGKKGTWYDHKVSVSDPQPLGEDAQAEEGEVTEDAPEEAETQAEEIPAGEAGE